MLKNGQRMESEHSSSARMFGVHCWKNEVPQRDVECVFSPPAFVFCFVLFFSSGGDISKQSILFMFLFLVHLFFFSGDTADGSEIRRSPVEVGS